MPKLTSHESNHRTAIAGEALADMMLVKLDSTTQGQVLATAAPTDRPTGILLEGQGDLDGVIAAGSTVTYVHGRTNVLVKDGQSLTIGGQWGPSDVAGKAQVFAGTTGHVSAGESVAATSGGTDQVAMVEFFAGLATAP